SCLAVLRPWLSPSFILRPPPSSSLFPYTTLFRSGSSVQVRDDRQCQFEIHTVDVLFPSGPCVRDPRRARTGVHTLHASIADARRSEEHTSELQSRENLVCRLLLEKKNTKIQPMRP